MAVITEAEASHLLCSFLLQKPMLIATMLEDVTESKRTPHVNTGLK